MAWKLFYTMFAPQMKKKAYVCRQIIYHGKENTTDPLT